MSKFQTLGNDLYTGERSFNFVGRRKIWFSIAGIAVLISILVPILRGGLELGIEFTGGSEFLVSQPATDEQEPAIAAAAEFTATPAKGAVLGDGGIRVQTDPRSQAANTARRAPRAEAYSVPVEDVNLSTIGPSWGQDITRQMVIGLGVFVAIAAILMSLYFRTWKMSIAALVALAHDLVVTAGVYAVTGVEVPPAAVIGFLTILGYSLYDTVVVFDKIRENAEDYNAESSRTFGELVNLAINQTLVRSINTSVVALLPVGAILFIGAFLMGAGTLRDIALALFIGIFVGALSTIFVAGPLYAGLRSREPEIARTDKRILAARARTLKERDEADADAEDDEEAAASESEPAPRASAS